MADVPFSDLHQTLDRMRMDYRVEKLDQSPLPSGGETLRHALVRRNSREVKGPETIEIWADPKTAMPRRIIFDQAKVQGSREPCRITLDLVSEDPLEADWFTPAPHVSAGRQAGAIRR
jgi:outer membrane lipoprotein-sorting protein